MKKFIVASVVAITLAAASAWAQTVTLAQWTFESAAANAAITNAPGNVGTASGPVIAENGLNSAISTARMAHAVSSTYSTPAGDLDLTIAALAPPPSPLFGPGLPSSAQASNNPSSHSYSANGWSVGDYWQFKTSTLGFTGIQVAWDQTGSNTGPRDFQLSYSFDGTSFTPVGSAYSLVFASWNATTAQGNNFLVALGAVDNQADVYFRIADTSTTSIVGGTVSASGTGRVDNFTVVGIPEPSTVALVGAGLAGLLALRRRRS